MELNMKSLPQLIFCQKYEDACCKKQRYNLVRGGAAGLEH